MYKLLIADDEPLALAGIKSMLDWASLDVEVIGTARNGGEALEIIERQMPDIVITDIKMPVKDGLSLARECNEKFESPPAFLILTSYDDFDFVRSAFQAKAIDYIIKTEINEKSLEAAINKAKEALRGVTFAQSSERLRESFFINVFNNLFENEETFTAQKKSVDIKNADFYVVADCNMLFPDGFGNYETNVRFLTNAKRITVDALTRYSECYAVTLNAWRFAVVFCVNNESGYKQLLSEAFRQASDDLQNSLGASLSVSVGSLVSDLRRLDISYSLSRSVRNDKSESGVYFHSHREHVVDNVKRYIRDNFNHSLSLNDVASALNFNPSYLSHLFSSYTGESIVEYITSLRITEAQRLLLTGEIGIADIAEQVGFESPFYFSRVFKRVTGLSPRDYAKSSGQTN